jgi:hypothetical protein
MQLSLFALQFSSGENKERTSQLKELCNEVLHDSYSSQNVTGMMEEVSQAHKILGAYHKGKILLRKTKHRLGDIVEGDI